MDVLYYQNRLENILSQHLSAVDDGNLKDAMRYAVFSGGKRFRAILVYLVSKMLGGAELSADSGACAIEFLHIYSLVHDDLPAMDDDNMRHSQPACHIKYGDGMAILVGDALQALAFEILANHKTLSPSKKNAMLETLAYYGGMHGMVGGQAIDLSITRKSASLYLLDEMYQKKTAALIRCAIKLGILTSKCKSKTIFNVLDTFAFHIGLAYQIQDDVLELTTSAITLGKNKNSDTNNQKCTYPVLLGLNKAKSVFNTHYEKAYICLKNLDKETTLLEKFMLKLWHRTF